MRHDNGTHLPARIPKISMEDVSRRLAEWRQTHKPPTPIPQELWSAAAELARVHGINPTARVLGLDYGALSRHVRTPPIQETPAAAFIEWVIPTPGNISVCKIEVESRHGAHMRIQLQNLALAGLGSIIRDFAG